MPDALPSALRSPLSNPVLQAHLDAIAALPLEELPLPDDALRLRPGIRPGRLLKHTWRSQVFPGTVRAVWIHVPDGHERTSAPARCMVFQDGLGYAAADGEARATMV